jgi:hypothetical protein
MKIFCCSDYNVKNLKISNLEKENVAGLSVSSDGRWILYTQQGVEGNTDIMLVDHFR